MASQTHPLFRKKKAGKPLENHPEHILISDEKELKRIGCPWKTDTLYVYRHMKKFPKLFTKIGGRVYLIVDELNRMKEKGIGK